MPASIIALIALAGLVCALAALVRYSIVFPRQPFTGALPALADMERATAARLKAHLVAIASRPRNIDHYPALEAAAVYIETRLRRVGLSPLRQTYDVRGRSVWNIEVVLEPPPGSRAAPTLVVGAHYDSPDDSPGANDNGTGVAALIELAERMAQVTPAGRRVRLVFFVNEEHPYGKTEAMGSWRHAKAMRDRGEPIAGMIALETLGYFSQAPGSQMFPAPFGLVYPDTGNFVAFVGLPGSRAFLHSALRAFRTHANFPSIGGVAPGFIEGIDLSDHWAYHHFRFPALMITDTAPFRNPYYHQRHDLPETVDCESLARVTTGLEHMIRHLAAP